MEDVVGRSLQVWLVASTIIATALFGLVGWKNRRATLPAGSIKFPAGILRTGGLLSSEHASTASRLVWVADPRVRAWSDIAGFGLE